MKAAMGWYVDPDDNTQERYWNGSMWQDQTRTLRPGRKTLQGDDGEAIGSGVTVSTNELLSALLVEQRRSANYLAILTYITVIILVLGVAACVATALLANS